MQLPALSDTIVAVSTGLQPSPVGVVRLSGSDAHALAARITYPAAPDSAAPFVPVAPQVVPARRARFENVRLRLPGWKADLVARRVLFFSPASYTGQDVMELFVPGSPPLLSMIVEALVNDGARHALPGEFTARAFRGGRLTPDQVESVRLLLQAGDRDGLAQAARGLTSEGLDSAQAIASELTSLIAALEAGIDFVDEEDIRFIDDAQLAARIDSLLARIEPLATESVASRQRGLPHVLLAGRPNAGKSTLFNALLGRPRAIATDLAGTTTDLLSERLYIEGHQLVLQDSAGLAAAGADLPLDAPAAHAARLALASASLVLWVHDHALLWTDEERRFVAELPADRLRIVLSRSDLPATVPVASLDPPGSAAPVRAALGRTEEVRAEVLRWLESRASAGSWRPACAPFQSARLCLSRVRELILAGYSTASPELIALELRLSVEALTQISPNETLVEEVLGRIFSQFCIGK